MNEAQFPLFNPQGITGVRHPIKDSSVINRPYHFSFVLAEGFFQYDHSARVSFLL